MKESALTQESSGHRNKSRLTQIDHILTEKTTFIHPRALAYNASIIDRFAKAPIPCTPRSSSRKIALPTKKGYTFASLMEIIRIEGEANYSTFHFIMGEKLLITKCLGAYEKLLESDYFCRTHKRHIVNLNYVSSFERGRYSTVSLENGHAVPLSYARRDQFMNMLSLQTIF